MNRKAGPLLLVWMVSAGAPAPAQSSSLTQPATADRGHTRAAYPQSTSARAARDTRSAALAAEQSTLSHELQQEVTQLRNSKKALNTEETRVKAGQAARSGLAPLRSKVKMNEARVVALRRRLAEVQAVRARLVSSPAAGAGAPGPSANHADRARLNARIRQLLTAQAAHQAEGSRQSTLYPGGVPAVQLTPAYPSLQAMAAQADTSVTEAVSRQSAAEAQYRIASDSLKATQERYKAGVVTQSEVSAQEGQVAKTQADLQAARSLLQARVQDQRQLARLAALQRPVDVELRDAPVRQAAETIAQASGLPIAVSDDVPAQTRLTVVARGVALATVLDTIARQSGLFIAPSPTGGGIELKPAPVLEVNGRRTELLTPFSPWSSEWGMNPAASAGYSSYGIYRSGLYSPTGSLRQAADGSHVYVVTGAGPNGAAPAPEGGAQTREKPATPQALPGQPGATPVAPGSPAPENAPPGRLFVVPAPSVSPGLYPSRPATPVPEGVYPPAAQPPGTLPFGEAPRDLFARPRLELDGGLGLPGGAAIAMTALNDSTFVVAHAAAGPGGAPAVMLTVYRLQGSELRVVSKTLHRLDAGNATRSLAPGAGGQFYGGFQPGRRGDLPRDFVTPVAPGTRPAGPAAGGAGRESAPSDTPGTSRPVEAQPAPVSPAPAGTSSSTPSAR